MKCLIILILIATLAMVTTSVAASLEAAQAALASDKPVAIAEIPAEWFDPNHQFGPEGDGAADWQYYLGEWAKTVEGEVTLVVISDKDFGAMFEVPWDEKRLNCLFFRADRKQGLLMEDCYIEVDTGAAITGWLKGGKAPSGLKLIDLKFRKSVASPYSR